MVSSLYCSNIAGWYGINTQDLNVMVNNKLQNYEFLMHKELSYLENFGGKHYLSNMLFESGAKLKSKNFYPKGEFLSVEF